MKKVKSYLETLDEYLTDAEKIVTYKWLSVELDISLTAAKRLLCYYIQKNDDLFVLYAIHGSRKCNDCIQTQVHVVPAVNLEDIKASLEEVFSVHVHSVSKSYLKDHSALLYAVDSQVNHSILSNSSSIPLLEQPTDIKNIKEEKKPLNNDNKHIKEEKKPLNNDNKHIKEEKKPPSKNIKQEKNTINSLFANSFKATNKKPAAVEKTGKNDSKSINKTKEETKLVFSKPKTSEKDLTLISKSEEVKTTVSSKTSKSVTSKSSSKHKKEVHPKRSRIMVLSSDSSDNDDEDKEEKDDVPEDDPIEDNIEEVQDEEVTIPVSNEKKRKLVDQTFKDEDGFFVTKKERVEVVDSEPEEASPPKKKQNLSSSGTSPKLAQPKKQPASTDNKKKPVTGKGKQASIMSFFKKK